MLTKGSFVEHEIPYAELQKLGISRKDILSLNPELMDTFMSGGFTPLIKMTMKGKQGATVSFLAKMRMVRDENNKISIEVLPMHSRLQKDDSLKLWDHELERMRRGEVIRKDIYSDNKKITMYAQLDNDTNTILKMRARDLVLPNALRGVELGQAQKDQIREGKPVEIDDDGDIYTVGIDLRQPTGINILRGGMEEWLRKLREWDMTNPGVIGYWHTSENSWEYMHVADSPELMGRISEMARESQDRTAHTYGMKL